MEDFSSDTEDGPTKFRRARWLLAVVALLVVAAMIFMRVTALPKYEGKPISHYLKDLKRSSRSGVYLTAVKAVEAVGSDALAYYVEQATDPLPWHVDLFLENRDKLPDWLGTRLNRWIDPYAVYNRKLGAVDAIFLIKDQIQDSSFTNELIRILPIVPINEMYQIAESLDALGASAADAVIPFLTGTNRHRVIVACEIIIDSESSATNAIPALTDLLDNGDPAVYRNVLLALQSIGEPAEPVLHSAFATDNLDLTKVLLRFFGRDPRFLYQVVALLHHANQPLRLNAFRAVVLRNTRPQGEPYWERLREDASGNIDDADLKLVRDDLMAIIENEFYAFQWNEKVSVVEWYIYQGADPAKLVAGFESVLERGGGVPQTVRAKRALDQIEQIQKRYDQVQAGN